MFAHSLFLDPGLFKSANPPFHLLSQSQDLRVFLSIAEVLEEGLDATRSFSLLRFRLFSGFLGPPGVWSGILYIV